eukprot:6187123-Pleurochrysis_carterae.AAC.4
MATAARMPCRPGHPAKLSASLLLLVPWCVSAGIMRTTFNLRPTSAASIVASRSRNTVTMRTEEPRRVVVVGAGWGGLSVAHALSKSGNVHVTVVDAAPRPGGLTAFPTTAEPPSLELPVLDLLSADGFLTTSGTRRAEAGQHGFWGEYHNIFALLDELSISDALTGYAEQGQYSPDGLQAVWPVYREQKQELPTGIGQALYTRFLNLPLTDLATAAPLVLAFSEFDDSPEVSVRAECCMHVPGCDFICAGVGRSVLGTCTCSRAHLAAMVSASENGLESTAGVATKCTRASIRMRFS